MSFDPKQFGDNMKVYEQKFAGQHFSADLPVCIRLDGKGFSKYTSQLEKPFDVEFSNIMIEVTKFLVKETNAVIGYTQSDEITLILYTSKEKDSVFFNGKIQKIISVITSLATAKFNKLVSTLSNIPEFGFFDCRAWQVPDKKTATDVLLWREIDATKNSVSMATRKYYTTSQIKGRSKNEMKEMLLAKGVSWDDYPVAFKRGTYVQRTQVLKQLEEDIIKKLPKGAPTTVNRNVISIIEMPIFSKIKNPVQVVFNGEKPYCFSNNNENIEPMFFQNILIKPHNHYLAPSA